MDMKMFKKQLLNFPFICISFSILFQILLSLKSSFFFIIRYVKIIYRTDGIMINSSVEST